MQNGDPRDGYFDPILTLMIDSYNPDSLPLTDPLVILKSFFLPVHILERNKQSRHLIFHYTFPHLSALTIRVIGFGLQTL